MSVDLVWSHSNKALQAILVVQASIHCLFYAIFLYTFAWCLFWQTTHDLVINQTKYVARVVDEDKWSCPSVKFVIQQAETGMIGMSRWRNPISSLACLWSRTLGRLLTRQAAQRSAAIKKGNDYPGCRLLKGLQPFKSLPAIVRSQCLEVCLATWLVVVKMSGGGDIH